MPMGYSKIAYRYVLLAGVAAILVFIAGGVIPEFAAAEPAEPILQLTPDTACYFLGPHLTFFTSFLLRGLGFLHINFQPGGVSESIKNLSVPKQGQTEDDNHYIFSKV